MLSFYHGLIALLNLIRLAVPVSNYTEVGISPTVKESIILIERKYGFFMRKNNGIKNLVSCDSDQFKA
jgi:hypothetical protein